MSNPQDAEGYLMAAAKVEYQTALDKVAQVGQAPTKRELFAAMAMQGLLAAVYSSKEMLNEFTTNERGKYPAHVTGAKAISENAVCYADALLAELAKERK